MAEGETIIVVSIPIEVQNLDAATAGFEALQAQLDALEASGPVVSEALSGIGASAAGIDSVAGSFGGATDAATGFGSAVEADTAQVDALASSVSGLASADDAAAGSTSTLASATADLEAAQSTSTGTTEALVAGLTAEEAAAAQAAAANASLSTSGEAVASAAGSEVAGIAGVTAGLTTQAGATTAAADAQKAYAAGLAGNAEAEGILATGTAAMTAADQALTAALRLQADAEIAVSQGENLAAAAARLHASALTAEDAQVVTLTANLNAEAAAAEKSAVSADAAGSAAAGAGSSMMMAGLAVGAVGVEAVKMGAGFEEAMSHIESFAGASHAEVQQMSEDVLQISESTGQGAKALADGLYYVESAGFKGADALNVLTESAKLAAASGADMKTVADGATSLMNAFGSQALSSSKAMDVMAATVTAGKMTLDDYARSVGTSAAVAHAFGISAQEMGASVAEMTAKGISARLAFTTFNSELQGLEKPTAGAQAAMKALGMSVDDVRKSIADNGLLATYQQLVTATHGNMTELEALIPNFRALRGVLVDLGPAGDDYKQKLDAITNSTGTASKAFDVWSATASASFAKFKASVEADMVEMGGVIAKALQPATDELTRFLSLTRDRKPDQSFWDKWKIDTSEILQLVGKLDPVTRAGFDAMERNAKAAAAASAEHQKALLAEGAALNDQDAILNRIRGSQQGVTAATVDDTAAVAAAEATKKQLAAADKTLMTDAAALEKAIRAEGVAQGETSDKWVASLQKEGDALSKLLTDQKAKMELMFTDPGPGYDNAIKLIAQDTDAAKEALDRYNQLKAEAFKPPEGLVEQDNRLKELNADLLIHESNMLNEVKGSKAWQEDARSVVAIKDTMIPQQKAINDEAVAATGLVQAWGKSLLDGTMSVETYNDHLNKLDSDTRHRFIPGLADEEQAIQNASQAHYDAGQKAQTAADDLHALATGFGFVAPAAGEAGTGMAGVGKAFDDTATHAKDMGTGVKTALDTMSADVGTAKGTVDTALTGLGTNAGTTQTTMSTALTTIGTDMGVLAFTTQTQTAAINAALQTSSTAATVTATGFGLSSAAMATSLDAGATSMGASARAINTAMGTISTKAESVKVVTDAQLSTIGAADIEPAGANGRAIGLALDAGVTAGVVAGAGAVAAAASAMVTNAIDAAKAAGAIQSPSGIMRDEVGLMMPAGMVEGVQNGAPAVNAAMDTMVTDGYLSAANASKPGAKGPTDLLAAQGQTAEAMYGQANTHGWGVANAFHSGHQAGMKAGTPGTVAVHNDTARVVKESTAPVWGQYGGYATETFFKGMNAGLTIQVKDLSHNLADALATVDLGTTEGSKLIREQITLIKDLSTIRHDDLKVAQEVSQLENGLSDKHKEMTADEIAQVQGRAETEKGVALGLANDLQAIQQKIREDAAAVQNAIGDDARLAAQNRLKEDMATEGEIRSAFHDTYGEWQTDERSLRDAQHQNTLDRINDLKAEMSAYKDLATAANDSRDDQSVLSKLNGQDEIDTHKQVNEQILTDDIATRERKRQLAVDAQTTLIGLDEEYAAAAKRVQDTLGTDQEQAARDAFTVIGQQRDAWRGYAHDLGADFDHAARIVTDDLHSLGATATDTAKKATEAEKDRHDTRMKAIDAEKTAGDRQFAAQQAGMTNATAAQKASFAAQKQAFDDHITGERTAENNLHDTNNTNINDNRDKAIKAFGDTAAAHTVMTGTMNANAVSAAAAWLGPAGPVAAINSTVPALNNVATVANTTATTSVNAAVRVGVAWSQVPNVMLPLAGALLQVSGTAQATGTQIAAAADTGMSSIIAFMMQTQAGTAQYTANWDTAITYIMNRYGISRHAAETSLSLQLNAAQTTAAGGVTAVVNANAQKTASNRVYHDGVIEQLGRQLQGESQTSAQYAQDWVREINLIETTFGVSFDQAQEMLRNFGDTGVLQLNRVQNAQDGVTGAVQRTIEALYLEGDAATAANKAIAGIGDKAAGGASAGGGGSAPAGQMTLGDILLKGGLVNGLLASALGGPQAGSITGVSQTNPGATPLSSLIGSFTPSVTSIPGVGSQSNPLAPVTAQLAQVTTQLQATATTLQQTNTAMNNSQTQVNVFMDQMKVAQAGARGTAMGVRLNARLI